MVFIGLIHKDVGSDFGVSFPDFPGVVTAGKTLDDARAMAEEALAFHVNGMIEDGEGLPVPSRLEQIIHNNPDAVAYVMANVSIDVAVRCRPVTLPRAIERELDKIEALQDLSSIIPLSAKIARQLARTSS
jgi:predicted RNase H-like HicB family nuclease